MLTRFTMGVTDSRVSALEMNEGDFIVTGGTMTEIVLAVHADRNAQLDPVVADEALWVEQARSGDMAAFDAIMTRYEGRLLRFLTGLVGDVEVAQDLCQDTFLAAYQAIPRLHEELRLSAWLHTIAINRARSHHRRWRFRRALPLMDEILPSRAVDLQESTATQDSVQRVLARLPKHYVEVLLLQTVSGLTCREIARIVGCSEGAVKVRLMRARGAFKTIYETEGR
ncbi:MAG: hypothetical protein PVSMB7_26690 [Chloroflexota bacterium]